jgi:glycosyltransferase involved in cell wall biosynthesis
MNILYVTEWFSYLGGGGEVVFCNLAIGMAKRGHNVDVICAKIYDAPLSQPDRIRVHRVGPTINVPPPSISQNFSFIAHSIKKGIQIIKENNIDVLHTNNLAPVIASSFLSKTFKVPLVVTIHDVFTTSSPGHWKEWSAQDRRISPITSFIAPVFEKLTVKMPSSVIHTVSDSSKEDLIKFGARGPIEVIPNGIEAIEDETNLRQRSYQNFLVFIGRLVFYKNVDTIISSFADVVKELPHSQLIIIGEGPMKEKLQKMVSDLDLISSIRFMGYLAEEEKLYFLRNCSALLLPSYVEGFGLVILEAFAESKPVLVANVRPLTEIVEDNIDGFILPVDNPRAWAQKIISLLRDRSLCEKMGHNGKLKAQNQYNLERALLRVEDLYERIIDSRPEDDSNI